MTTTLPRLADPRRWDDFVRRHPEGWFFHTSDWIDYCLAYRPDAVDLSQMVCDDDGVVRAVVPMVLEGGTTVGMGGEPCAGPLIEPGHVWYLGVEVSALVESTARAAGATRARFRWHPGTTPYGLAFLLPTWSTWNTQVLDLRPDEHALWRGVRKSYRYLVRDALKRRSVIVGGPGFSWALHSVAKELHARSAGRQTRSDRTWNLMADWMERGTGLLALISYETDENPDTVGVAWAGFAYVIRDKHWAYYASGATLEKDIAHALQWELIRTLRADGRLYYELGWHARAHEADDTKALGIAQFKQGFGGSAWEVRAADWTPQPEKG